MSNTDAEMVRLAVTFSDMVVADLDLSGEEFEGLIFDRCLIQNINFSKTVLKNCTFRRCTFCNIEFSETKVLNCTISYCDTIITPTCTRRLERPEG